MGNSVVVDSSHCCLLVVDYLIIIQKLSNKLLLCFELQFSATLSKSHCCDYYSALHAAFPASPLKNFFSLALRIFTIVLASYCYAPAGGKIMHGKFGHH
jgi:hypothetical protein